MVREYADGSFDLCATDAIVKARYKRLKTGRFLSLADPFDIELSLVNNFALVGDTCNLHIKGHVLKGIFFNGKNHEYIMLMVLDNLYSLSMGFNCFIFHQLRVLTRKQNYGLTRRI